MVFNQPLPPDELQKIRLAYQNAKPFLDLLKSRNWYAEQLLNPPNPNTMLKGVGLEPVAFDAIVRPLLRRNVGTGLKLSHHQLGRIHTHLKKEGTEPLTLTIEIGGSHYLPLTKHQLQRLETAQRKGKSVRLTFTNQQLLHLH